MAELPQPEVIFTHESDLDGYVAGALLQRLSKKLYGVEVPLEAYHYNYWKSRDLREKSAWVADFAFEPRMDKPNWVVFDHHATSLQPKAARLIHNTAKSAGLLAYELCLEHGIQSAELDRIVKLNNISDLFLEQDPDFDLACDYANLVKVYQFWNLHALIGNEIEKFLEHPLLEVISVKRRVEDPIGLAWSRQCIQEISPEVGYVETVIGNTNLIVHQLLEDPTVKYPVLATLFKRANNLVIASFRSRGGESLKIAEKLQGGGHPNASGALLPKSVKNIPDAIEYLRTVLQPAKTATSINGLENLFAGFEAVKK